MSRELPTFRWSCAAAAGAFTLAFTGALLAGCGEGSGDAPAPTAMRPAIGELAAVLCDAEPTWMGADAEKYTSESWTCTHAGEHIRIDLYADQQEMTTAKQVVIDFYKSTGDTRTLDQLPLLCGDLWVAGTDLNETRDALIANLYAATIPARTCTN